MQVKVITRSRCQTNMRGSHFVCGQEVKRQDVAAEMVANTSESALTATSDGRMISRAPANTTCPHTTWQDDIWASHILYAHMSRGRAVKQVSLSTKLSVDIVWLHSCSCCLRGSNSIIRQRRGASWSSAQEEVRRPWGSSSCFPVTFVPPALYQSLYPCLRSLSHPLYLADMWPGCCRLSPALHIVKTRG